MKTPLIFEPNCGQAVSEFRWIGRGAGFRVGITSDGAMLEFRDRKAAAPAKQFFVNAAELTKPRTKQESANGALFKFHLLSSNSWRLDGVSPTGGISNYFIGNTRRTVKTEAGPRSVL